MLVARYPLKHFLGIFVDDLCTAFTPLASHVLLYPAEFFGLCLVLCHLALDCFPLQLHLLRVRAL